MRQAPPCPSLPGIACRRRPRAGSAPQPVCCARAPAGATLPLTLPRWPAHPTPTTAPSCVFRVTPCHETVLPLASREEPEPLQFPSCKLLRACSLASSPLPPALAPLPSASSGTPLNLHRPSSSMARPLNPHLPKSLLTCGELLPEEASSSSPTSRPLPLRPPDFWEGSRARLPCWLSFHLPALFNPLQCGLCPRTRFSVRSPTPHPCESLSRQAFCRSHLTRPHSVPPRGPLALPYTPFVGTLPVLVPLAGSGTPRTPHLL